MQKRQKAEEKARKENQKFSADFDELSTLGSIEASDPLDLEIEQLQEQIELLQQQKESIEDIDYSVRLDALDEENEKIQEQIDLLREQQDAIKDVDFSGSIEAYETQISSLNEKINELNESVVENPLIEQNELLIEQLQEEIDLLQDKKSELQEIVNSGGTTSIKFEADSSSFNAVIDEMIADLTGLKEEMIDPIWGSIKEAAKGAWEEIKLAGSETWDDLTSDITGMKEEFSKTWTEIKETASAVWDEIEFGANVLWDDFITDMKEMKIEGIKCANEGIDAAEGVVNAIIRGLNWCAEKINDIFCIEIPDWVPKYGGETFAANLGQVSEWHPSRIPVPALAQGTVIPPNKPFLAWLGDQKNGTNIEAPLSTIEDAMRNVLDEKDFNFNFTANGSLGALIRILKIGLKREGERETAFG